MNHTSQIRELKNDTVRLKTVLNVKSSEDQLRHMRASLDAIIENSSATIYSLDHEFRYINFNSLLKDALKQVYGIDIQVGDVVFDFLYKDDPDQADEWREIYSRALEGESMQFIKEFDLGESQNIVKFYINPIKVGPQVTGLTCLAIDITKERLAEMKLARSEAKFRALIENNQDAMMIRDENRNMVYSSPSMARMLGYSDEEIELRKAPEMLVHEGDALKLAKLYEEARKRPGTPIPTSIRLKHRRGHYIWIEGVMTNMLDDHDVVGFVCNFRDVTQKMEQDLKNEMISKDIAKRNETLEQYAYIVSHNLRAPIANLVGLANLLALPGIDQQDRENALGHIINSAHRLDDVIKDLSSILQTTEELNHHRETVRFQDLVDQIRPSIENVIASHQVSIQTDFSRCNGAMTIKSYMHSIFYNLISNSIKYRNPKIPAVIRIRSERKNGRIFLVFEDNGSGIDLRAYGDKLFGLYQRFHPDQAEGKGLGLFKVKTQVENLRGKISVQSAVGSGTTFTIELCSLQYLAQYSSSI